MFKWFKDFVGYKESNATTSNATSASAAGAAAALALAAANDHKTPSGASGTAASSAGANDFVSPQRERYVSLIILSNAVFLKAKIVLKFYLARFFQKKTEKN